MSTQIETNLLLQENGYPNRRPSPDYDPVLTISESGMPILETVGDIVMPADYSFACINNYVHCEDPIYEELQSLALGMASHIEALQRQLAAKDAALGKIERWWGEFPNTGRTWDDGATMSYAACYGSNGERDYMRKVAREGLAAQAGQEPIENRDWSILRTMIAVFNGLDHAHDEASAEKRYMHWSAIITHIESKITAPPAPANTEASHG